jgi:hypothetical protein
MIQPCSSVKAHLYDLIKLPRLHRYLQPGNRLIRERLKQIMALYLSGPVILLFTNEVRNNTQRLEAYFLFFKPNKFGKG